MLAISRTTCSPQARLQCWSVAKIKVNDMIDRTNTIGLDPKAIRNEFVSHLKELDVRFHLTMDCSANTSPLSGRRLLNLFIKELNLSRFKKRSSDGKSYFTGFVIEEPTGLKSTIHFHILLHVSTQCPAEYMPTHEDLEMIIDKINFRLKLRKSKEARKSYFDNFLLQTYEQKKGKCLFRYLTKNMESGYHNGLPDYIGILDSQEVWFGSEGKRTLW